MSASHEGCLHLNNCSTESMEQNSAKYKRNLGFPFYHRQSAAKLPNVSLLSNQVRAAQHATPASPFRGVFKPMRFSSRGSRTHMTNIRVYGTDSCPMTKASLIYLDSQAIPYEYIDIEENAEAAAWVRAHNGGKERKPTIEIGRQILIEPSDEELEDSVRSHGLLN
jgi:mycoredoxin